MESEHSWTVAFSTVSTLSPKPHKRVFNPSSLRPLSVYSFTFNFKCETIVQDWTSAEYSTDFVTQHPCHVTDNSFNLNLVKNDYGILRLRLDIERELHNWPLPEPYRRLMIKKVVRRAMRLINSSKGTNNFLMNVDVNHLCNRVFLLETCPKMVPATNESIESLEKKKGTVSVSCSICLEDFLEGCLVATMPCSHEFHGECVEKWLKTSHYCPLCRYEMPKLK